MARKRTFRQRGGKEAIWGRERREISFPELDEGTGLPDNLKRRLKKVVPPTVYRRLQKVTGVHLVVGLLVCAALGFLVWFFFFAYPSPIGGLEPEPGGFTKNPNVDIRATIGRKIRPGQLALAVDGKDVTPSVSMLKDGISCKLALVEGRHEVKLTLDTGGLMGKRESSWSFTVDTTPPKLVITRKKITDSPAAGKVGISFSGETEKGATVKAVGKELPVNEKGRFRGRAACSRSASLEITATDEAGNVADTFIVTQKRTEAKGAHVSIFMAGSTYDMNRMFELVERTELNALQIDLKDEAGYISYEGDNKLAEAVGAYRDYIDLDQCVDSLRYRDIYAIGRVVLFKDPRLAAGRPDLAVHDKYGGLWGTEIWMDPYSREVWDYNLAVAIAAAKAGFQEIQFDYVRFPSDGDVTTCLYPKQDGRTQSQVIEEFLDYARQKLSPYNVFISADVFGLTASRQGEMGIGQNVRSIAKKVDYLCPMVYPSHYNPGEYRIKDPEANPFDTVSRSIEDFQKVVKGTSAQLRPWLQDFSLRIEYTADMVRRQINAVEQSGIKEWLLWDPECTYTEKALRPE